MLNMFVITHHELDGKISKLDSKVSSLSSTFISYPSKEQWNDVFNLATEINNDFKSVRYLTGKQRHEAWQKFFSIRQKAFEVSIEQRKTISREQCRRLKGELRGCEYSALMDAIWDMATLGLMKTTVEEMKRKGRELKEIRNDFNNSKHLMIKEDINEIQAYILEIKQSHDSFWGTYKNRIGEIMRLREEGRRAASERSQVARERIENNLSQNRGKLSDALGSLQIASLAFQI